MVIRVLLADDHRVVREALQLALARESDLEVIGEAGSAQDAMQLVRALRPDVVVLDIGLPDLSGMEVAARVRRMDSPPRSGADSVHPRTHHGY